MSGWRRLRVLLRTEARKLLARRLTWIAFLVVVLVALVGPWAGKVVDTARSLGADKGPALGGGEAYRSGWVALASAVGHARLVLLGLLLMLSASSVSEETSLGTLKALCTRPLRRSELLLSKLAVIWGYGVVLHLAMIAAAALGAELTYGLYDVPVDPLFPERIKHAFGDMCVLLYEVTALSALPLLSLCALGLLCSVLLEHSGHATGVAIGATLLCSAAAGLSDRLQGLVFTVQLASSFEAFRDIAERYSGAESALGAAIPAALLVPVVWALVLFAIGALLLERRDVG